MCDTDRPTSLWEYALARYAQPGIEPLCLALQDAHGWDICELLWIAWLTGRGREPDAPALAPVRSWQREMTWPLRERRRALKAQVAAEPRLQALRQALKQAELESEREALARLEILASRPRPAAKRVRPRWQTALEACRCLTDGRAIESTAPDYPLLRQLFARWEPDASGAEPNPTC